MDEMTDEASTATFEMMALAVDTEVNVGRGLQRSARTAAQTTSPQP